MNTTNSKEMQASDPTSSEYSVVFRKLDNFDNFKISKQVREDFLLTKVYEIIDKNYPTRKYFAEFVGDEVYNEDRSLFDFYQNQINRSNKIFKKINHGSISNYIGTCPHLSNDSRNFVLISKFYQNGSLIDFHEFQNEEKHLPFSINTYKQIILYGIASGMAFLSDKENMKPIFVKSNIRLDEFLFPKISFYGIERIYLLRNDHNKFRYRFNETILDSSEGINKNIFLYSLILYEFVTNKKPFEKLNSNIAMKFLEGYRPPLDDDIPINFRKLIQKCWSINESDRPDFNSIVQKLKKQQFILDGVDEKAYYHYIGLIDEYQKEVNDNKIEYSFEYFVSKKSEIFKKIVIDSLNMNENENEDGDERNALSIDYLDLSKFTVKKLIGQGVYGKVFIVENKETGKVFAAKISKKKIFKHDEKNTNIYREAKFISKLNHPCILKFIGYSPLDFENNKKPVIITEYNSNGSLESLLDLERRNVEIDE